MIYADRQEVLRRGDVYYLPSGHAAVLEDDFDSLEFSPSAALEQVLDVVESNPAMAQTASV